MRGQLSAAAPTAGGTAPILPPLYPLPLLVIIAAAFAVIAPFFFLGVPSGHDFEFHLNSWAEVLSQWKQGILFPRWAALAHYGYGEPRFIFYPPISWLVGAALAALLPWALVPGAFCWIALTLSGCSMFILARRWLGRADATFAAALYVVNPYHIVDVYWRSAYAELLTAALLPFLFLLVLRLDDRKWIIPLGLVVAGACLTDVPGALMLNYSAGLLLVVLALSRRWPRILLYGGLAIFIGMVLSAFFLLPAIYEQRWINIAQVLSDNVRPRDNFLFAHTADVGHNQFNRLISFLVLGQVGALALTAFRWRRWAQKLPRIWWLLAAWACACVLLFFPFTLPAWDYLPKLRYLQFPWRWLLCLNVALALLVTVAWRRWWPRALVYGSMLAVLLLAGLRPQTLWWDSAKDVRDVVNVIPDSSGYEGTDEYTPLRADAYNISQNAPLAAFRGRGSATTRISRWAPESRIFRANTASAGVLVLQLFNYPAWHVEVNGHTVITGTEESTGQMVVPVESGENRVDIAFTRTPDRLLGSLISAIAAVALLVIVWFRRRRMAVTQESLAA